MRALVYERFGGPLDVREVPDPVAPAGGVVVRVGASGLCRSDWHAWVGYDDTVRLPHVPGHELAGVVGSVGPGVGRWRVGDRVTAPFVCGCGRCEWCLAGQAQVCPDQTQPGFTDWGSHAELVVVRAADLNLVAVPDALSDEAAASLGCRFATAYRAVSARAAVQPGEWVVVVGAGGVGLSAVMVAAALGAHVVAVDTNPAALDLARRVGATATVSAKAGAAESVTDQVREITGGGAHVSVDAVGSAQTCRDAVLSLRRRGRHAQVGLLSAQEQPMLPMDRVIAWELDILGSHGMAARDYPGMLDLVVSRELRPSELLGRTVGMREAAAMIPLTVSNPQTGMTVLQPQLD